MVWALVYGKQEKKLDGMVATRDNEFIISTCVQVEKYIKTGINYAR